MTTITSKKTVNKGVKSMTAKAMSWSQVCKQISGIGGYVELDEGEKVRPLELMQALGVKVAKNSYKPADIFGAWNERMKDGKQIMLSKGVPFNIELVGYSYRLHTKSQKGEYVGVSVKQLCPLVSAEDKDPEAHTVTVSASNVLRGLSQSLFVDDTLDNIKKSEEKCAAMTEGYINLTRDKKLPEQWVRVAKDEDGVWTIESEEAAAAKEAAKKALKESAFEELVANYNMGYISKKELDTALSSLTKTA